jgi:hypothetical protein
VNFEDSAVVALADESTRAGLFDQDSLSQLLACAYDGEAMGPFQGNLQPLFEDFEVGYAAPSFATVDGRWAETGGTDRTEAHMRIAGLGGVAAPRVDALWRGAILARYADTGEEILEPLSVAWPRGDEIDAAVAAANGGSLPSGAALETARRGQLLASLRSQFGDTTAPFRLEEDEIKALVKSAGASSVGNFLEHAQEPDRATAVLELLFAEPAGVSVARRPLPVTVALLVRDEPLAVAELLQDTRRVRERLASLGVERPRADGAMPRHAVVVAWVVPLAAFDDDDWPGADRDARRTQAGEWLARQGIGLVAVP